MIQQLDGGVALPEAQSMIDDDLVTFAIWLIDQSQVAVEIEAALTKSTGRPRTIPVRAVFVALLLLAIDGRSLLLTSVTELLFQRLNGEHQAALALSGDVGNRRSFLAAYRRVRYCFGAICSVVDPSPRPKNRCMTNEELSARTRSMSEDDMVTARSKLEQLINSLIEACVSVLTDNERAAFDGSVGLDATCLPLFSRGPSKTTDRTASDPDGGWYIREGDHRDEHGLTGKTLKKIAWALEATLVTMAQSPGVVPTFPNLVLGLALTRPGEDPGATGTRVIASIAARGHKAHFVGADRAYSGAKPNKFHLPVAALGYSLIMDYRANELGRQGSSGGAVLIEGNWYCPSIPKALITATKDFRAATIDKATYQARITARVPYRLKRKDGPDPDGYERLACPALGNHPGLMCPLRNTSMTPRNGRIKVLNPPDNPPKLCCQTAITIAPDVGARHRQQLAFGTEEWARRYATCRNTIEGLNGFIKDPAHEALHQPGRRRVRGIAAQSIFCAFLVMAANLRKIRTFRNLVAEGRTDEIAARARRRRVSLGDYLPATG